MRQVLLDKIFTGTDEQNAQLCRDSANWVSLMRNQVATDVATNIVLLDHKYPLIIDYGTKRGAAVTVALTGADKLDGMIARYGMKHFGLERSKVTDELDPLLDKEFNRLMMDAFSIRSQLEGHSIYSNILEWILAQTENRDIKMNEARSTAPEGQDTSAIKIAKYKTGMQNFGHILAMSPYNRTLKGQALIVGAYSAGLAIGEVSLVQAQEVYAGSTMPSLIDATMGVVHQLSEEVDFDISRFLEFGDIFNKYKRMGGVLLNPVQYAPQTESITLTGQ